jgi:hypothetical protein
MTNGTGVILLPIEGKRMAKDQLNELALNELYLERDIFDALLSWVNSDRPPEKQADSDAFILERIKYLVSERADIINKNYKKCD